MLKIKLVLFLHWQDINRDKTQILNTQRMFLKSCLVKINYTSTDTSRKYSSTLSYLLIGKTLLMLAYSSKHIWMNINTWKGTLK